jgi:hypothetical protein
MENEMVAKEENPADSGKEEQKSRKKEEEQLEEDGEKQNNLDQVVTLTNFNMTFFFF